jgi:hypothetical protein
MAEGKNKIIIYRDWITTFESLSDEEAGRLIKHLFLYVNDKNPKPADRLTALLFEPIKQTLKRDLKKYEAICLRNRINGELGGRPINNPDEPSGLINNPDEPKITQTNPDEPDSDSDSDKKIEKREIKFKSEVFEFLNKYPEVLLNKFCNYWTEKNKSRTKMRFELEKTFEIDRRLSTWASKDKDFNKGDIKPEILKIRTGEFSR